MPYDIFHQGGVTQAALNYLKTPGFSNGYTSQSVVGLQLDSDLGAAYGWRTPWAKNGAAVAVGLERRVEKLVSRRRLGAPGCESRRRRRRRSQCLNGQYTVKEAYVEGRLPIMEQKDWAYLLSVNGSYRYSDYSTDQTTNSYGLGVEWAPVKDYKLRGTLPAGRARGQHHRAVTPQGLNLYQQPAADPCGGPDGPTATLAQLRSVPAWTRPGTGRLASTNPAGQYNFLQGGNPNAQAGNGEDLHDRPRHDSRCPT